MERQLKDPCYTNKGIVINAGDVDSLVRSIRARIPFSYIGVLLVYASLSLEALKFFSFISRSIGAVEVL